MILKASQTVNPSWQDPSVKQKTEMKMQHADKDRKI